MFHSHSRLFNKFHLFHYRNTLFSIAPFLRELIINPDDDKTVEVVTYNLSYEYYYDKLSDVFISSGNLETISLSESKFSDTFLKYLSGLGARTFSLRKCDLVNSNLPWIFSSMSQGLEKNKGRLRCLDMSANYFGTNPELFCKFFMDNKDNVDFYNFNICLYDTADYNINNVYRYNLHTAVNSFITRIKNKKRMLLILLDRRANENSIFSEQNLPLDLLKIIYYLVVGERSLILEN